MKAPLPALAVNTAEFSLFPLAAKDLRRKKNARNESRDHSDCAAGSTIYQLLPTLIARGPDDGAGDATRTGSDIFFDMRSMMRSAAA